MLHVIARKAGFCSTCFVHEITKANSVRNDSDDRISSGFRQEPLHMSSTHMKFSSQDLEKRVSSKLLHTVQLNKTVSKLSKKSSFADQQLC